MRPPLRISPDQALRDMQRFSEKLAAGVRTFGEMGELESGVTPKDAVYGEDKMVLYRYRPRREALNPVPLLIVYALANRPYMTDIQEDRSTIRGLMEAGQDVYLIDWGYPDEADRYLGLDDYINRYVDGCCEHIRAARGVDRVNVLGICQGGAFSLCYAALHPHKVRNLVTMVTPVDFHAPGSLLAHWVQRLDVDLLVDTLGNVPGELLNWTFLSLKPLRLSGQKYLDMVGMLDDPRAAKNFMRMEKWIHDSPAQAGEAFREFVKGFFQGNGLVKGAIEIGGRRVSLRDVTMPVLNVYATEDHLVPPASSRALAGHVGSADYSELSFKGGHIGIYVSGRAKREVPPAIGAWLNARAG